MTMYTRRLPADVAQLADGDLVLRHDADGWRAFRVERLALLEPLAALRIGDHVEVIEAIHAADSEAPAGQGDVYAFVRPLAGPCASAGEAARAAEGVAGETTIVPLADFPRDRTEVHRT